MADCLVTTLKESVTDMSLTKLDELKVHVSAISQSRPQFLIFFTTASSIKIDGDAYFTDSTGTANYGKTKEIPANINTKVYLSKGNVDLIFSKKYNLLAFLGYVYNSYDFDLSDVKWLRSMLDLDLNVSTKAKGDIADALLLPSARNINLKMTKCYGDISCLENAASPNYTVLMLSNINATGDVSVFANNHLPTLNYIGLDSTKVRGNISAFANRPNLTSLGLANTGVTGNISSLSEDTALTELYLSNTSITGDTSSLAGLTNLTTFTYANTAITGTWPLV